MQVVMIVRRDLKTTCASMPATRLTVLCVAVEALIHGGRLTVTGLGRAGRGRTTVKHTIKRMDRLLSNGQLYGGAGADSDGLDPLDSGLPGSADHPRRLVGSDGRSTVAIGASLSSSWRARPDPV